MKKSDISNISNAESVERAEESVRSSVQPSGKFGGKADRLFGADPAGLDESARGIAVLVIVGVAVGLLSGMFGIGGGTVIVPALVWLGLTQRNAAATSMLAIVPTSISGVISYATCGNVDWLAALLLFCGTTAFIPPDCARRDSSALISGIREGECWSSGHAVKETVS